MALPEATSLSANVWSVRRYFSEITYRNKNAPPQWAAFGPFGNRKIFDDWHAAYIWALRQATVDRWRELH